MCLRDRCENRGPSALTPFAAMLLAILLSVGRAQASPYELQANVTLYPEDLQIEPAGEYHRITIAGASLDAMREHAGQPQLPVIVKWFLLPPDYTVAHVEITALASAGVPGTYLPIPILDPASDGAMPPEPPNWPAEVYPQTIGGLIHVEQNRTYRLAKIGYYPLQYSPSTRQLTMLSAVQVRLTLRPLTETEQRSALQFARPYSADDPFSNTRNWIQATVINVEDLDTFYPRYPDATPPAGGADKSTTPGGAFVTKWPSRDGLPVPYVVITNNRDDNGNDIGDMTSTFLAWADVLRSYGIQTVVTTVDAIESMPKYADFDRPMRIRNFIADAVENWGTSYVLLGGDVSVVPTRRAGGPNQTSSDWDRPDPVADYWYTRVGHNSGGQDLSALWNDDFDSWIGEGETDIQGQNDDVISALWLGRLPARNASEAAAMVQRTMRYMLFPPYDGDAASAAFYHSATVAAGPTNSMDPQSDYNGIGAAERYVIPQLTYSGSPWQVSRHYPNVGMAQDTCNQPPAMGTCYTPLYNYVLQKLGSPPDYWEGNDLQLAMDGNAHVLYHYDHSNRGSLGRASCPCDIGSCLTNLDQSCPSLDGSDCCKALEGYLRSAIASLDVNQVLGLQNGAGTTAKYFFAFSNGSWTNMIDMNSIGEAFLRAPDGGAVGYLGNSITYNGGASADQVGRAFTKLFDTRQSVKQWTQAWYEAVDESFVSSYWWSETRMMCEVPQLGDPMVWPWRNTPVGISITTSPSTIPVGTPTVTVTARRADTQGLLAGVLICLQQGTWTYATATTNSQGQAVFGGVQIQSGITPVTVSALLPGYKPSKTTVSVDGGAPVVYVRHAIDDCVTGGDCDDVLEAGEQVGISVTVQNRGDQTSAAGTLALYPTPGLTCELKINAEYRPGTTLLGRATATAPSDADSFRIPLTYRGERIEGPPTLPPSGEVFRLWRVDNSGLYTVGMRSSSASSDTIFSGVIVAQGGLTDVQKTGEVSDTYVASGDTLSFEFHGDATEDRLTFRAEAPDWITMTRGSSALRSLQPGDSATITFNATVLADCPDRQDLYFTVSATPTYGSTSSHSDFAQTFAKPTIALMSVDRDFGDFGCQDTTWRWMPAIKNVGSGQADSVVLRLRKTSGTMDVVDSVAVFTGVGADSLSTGDGFLICGASIADTAGFEAEIHEDVYHRVTAVAADVVQDPDCHPLDAPADVQADLVEGTVLLRWTAVSGATGYRIEYATSPSASTGELLDRVDAAATRYQVRADLIAPGENGSGYDTPYYFFVRACSGYFCFERTRVGPVYPWVKERAGWPQLLPETSVCAPSVALVDDDVVAIIAATDKIYAFKPDGSALDPAGSGLLFDPGLATRAPDQRFTEALSVGDWVSQESPSKEIAANLSKVGTYFLEVKDNGLGQCCEAELICQGSQYSLASPMVSRQLPSGGLGTGTFLAGSSDGRIYSWDGGLNTPVDGICDGNILSNQLADGSGYNYQSLAVVPAILWWDVSDLVAVTRKGTLADFALWSLDGLTPYWSRQLSKGWLSTPAVGDVDGFIDGDTYPAADVVVTSQWGSADLPDSIFVVDQYSGQPKSWSPIVGTDWHFRRGGSDVPPAGPALADIDGDCRYEIIVAGLTAAGVDGAETYPRELSVHIFDYTEEGTVEQWHGTASIPYNYRNDTSGHPTSGNHGVVFPIGTPIVGDFDYDGTFRPDIVVTASNGAIYAFEYDPATHDVTPKPGWPLLLPDVAREPVLCQLDAESEQYSLVVQCQDGWLHVFDLPMATSPSPEDGTWASYGYDGGNSRTRDPGCGWKEDDKRAELSGSTLPAILGVGPVPSRGRVAIRLASRGQERISLQIFDVSGRAVRTLALGSSKAGVSDVVWDGRDDTGNRLASGVYWCVLRAPGADERRRIVILH